MDSLQHTQSKIWKQTDFYPDVNLYDSTLFNSMDSIAGRTRLRDSKPKTPTNRKEPLNELSYFIREGGEVTLPRLSATSLFNEPQSDSNVLNKIGSNVSNNNTTMPKFTTEHSSKKTFKREANNVEEIALKPNPTDFETLLERVLNENEGSVSCNRLDTSLNNEFEMNKNSCAHSPRNNTKPFLKKGARNKKTVIKKKTAKKYRYYADSLLAKGQQGNTQNDKENRQVQYSNASQASRSIAPAAKKMTMPKKSERLCFDNYSKKTKGASLTKKDTRASLSTMNQHSTKQAHTIDQRKSVNPVKSSFANDFKKLSKGNGLIGSVGTSKFNDGVKFYGEQDEFRSLGILPRRDNLNLDEADDSNSEENASYSQTHNDITDDKFQKILDTLDEKEQNDFDDLFETSSILEKLYATSSLLNDVDNQTKKIAATREGQQNTRKPHSAASEKAVKKDHLVFDSDPLEKVLLGGPGGSYAEQKQRELKYSQRKKEKVISEQDDHNENNIDLSELDMLAYQAQAKIALVDEQINKLQRLHEELEQKGIELDHERSNFERQRDEESLRLATERETFLLEVQQLKSQLRKAREYQKISMDDPDVQEVMAERDQLENENFKLRVRLVQLQEEFAAKELRYRKLVNRLGNQIYSLEKKNKTLTSSLQNLEQSSHQLNLHLNQQQKCDKSMQDPPEHLAGIRRNKKDIKSMSTNNTIERLPPYIQGSKEIRLGVSNIPRREKRLSQLEKSKLTNMAALDQELLPDPTLNNVAENTKITNELYQANGRQSGNLSNRDLDDTDSMTTQCHSTTTAETRAGDHLTTSSASYVDFPLQDSNTWNTHQEASIEKNVLPIEEYTELLEFSLEKFWKPFDDAIRVLNSPGALQLARPVVHKPDGRQEFHYQDGHREILFLDNMRKVICPNGWVFTFLTNGDIRGSDLYNRVYYYHCQDKIYNITMADGSIYNIFSDGQVDRTFPDGKIQVRFPGGILKQIDTDGTQHVQYYRAQRS